MCVAEKNVEVSDTTSEVKVRCCVRVRDIFCNELHGEFGIDLGSQGQPIVLKWSTAMINMKISSPD